MVTEDLSVIPKATCGQPDAFLLCGQNSAPCFNSTAVTTKPNKKKAKFLGYCLVCHDFPN